jgi:hypothetical protein
MPDQAAVSNEEKTAALAVALGKLEEMGLVIRGDMIVHGDLYVQISQAVSLKRLADSLEAIAKK